MSERIPGIYFDGKSSLPNRAELQFLGGNFLIYTETLEPICFPYSAGVFLDKIGSADLVLEFQDLSRFQSGHEAFGALKKELGGGDDFIHVIENQWRFALASIVAVAMAFAVFLQWGLPQISKKIAFRLSDVIATTVSNATLEAIDKTNFLKSTGLTPAEQMKIQLLSVRLRKYFPNQAFSLLFRHGGPIGANAFALPNGNILVTDEIAKLLSEDELTAILIHEIGHVLYKHGIRSLIESSILSTLLLSLSGNSNWAGLPTALLTNGYSRDFEREADDLAVRTLNLNQLKPSLLSDALRKITPKNEDDFSFLRLFSTHPATKDRIERIREMSLILNFK